MDGGGAPLDASNVIHDAALVLDADSADAAMWIGPRPPTAIIDGRPVQGVTVEHTNAFLGMRYGKAPVGELRFAPPQPADPWPGMLDATQYGPDCPQSTARGKIPGGTQPQSEDCLRINVFTPINPPAAKLPVMLFIHGGKFAFGGGSDLEGHYLSQSRGVVVVSINYRLGALGFLVDTSLDTTDVPSGNYGLRDQQLALRWVRENIAAFGGDANNITAFGQSSGAQCICYHLFARGSEKLFDRAIMESGTCVDYPAVPLVRSRVQTASTLLIDDLCSDRTDTAACLRGLPAEQIAMWTRQGLPGAFGEDFLPQIDGTILEVDPWKSLAAGAYSQVPMIIGSQPNEWAVVELYGGSEVPHPTNMIELGLVVYGLYPSSWTDILDHYAPLGTPDDRANDVLGRIVSDSWFHCPGRTLARGASAQGSSVWLYSFEVPPAVHGEELDYVFGYPWVSGLLAPPLFSPAAPVPILPNLVEAMQTYWTNFAATGTPNATPMPMWPQYAIATDQNQTFAAALSVGTKLDDTDCAFWDAIHAKEHQASP